MKILITGSTGFIGKRLTEQLLSKGHSITRLVRSSDEPGLVWDPEKHILDISRLEGYDAVIHLAGESIQGRWTARKKKKIIDSRTKNTAFLVESLLKLKTPPKAFISASAIGYYGDRADESLTESSPPGNDFLAEVCIKWEAATTPLAAAGIRVVHVRTGIVLHPDGGALKPLLLPTKFGVAGPLGSGSQWWSWVSMQDMLGIYVFAVENETVKGAINAVSPNALRQKDFQKILSKVLHRPSFMPLPAFAIKIMFGEMSALLLNSQHVIPEKLEKLGYSFKDTNLEATLENFFP